jgi:predicted amidohydrolase
MLRVACLQINSGDQMVQNIATITAMLREAAAQGARLAALPENAFLMAIGDRFHSQVFEAEQHPALQAMQLLAAELKLWILIGSLAVKPPSAVGMVQDSRYYNRSYLLSPEGKIAASYDKIHLFDVSVPQGESHQESARFQAGDRAVVVKTEIGIIGMSICYDLRFPQLYRSLAKAGAEILTTPAAFTRFTGEKGGWHVLNRARAMETGCFVIAPAQCGHHAGGRETFGHSLIINPWGEILAEATTEPTILYATIDLAQVQQIRHIMPSLQHDREFSLACC